MIWQKRLERLLKIGSLKTQKRFQYVPPGQSSQLANGVFPFGSLDELNGLFPIHSNGKVGIRYTGPFRGFDVSIDGKDLDYPSFGEIHFSESPQSHSIGKVSVGRMHLEGKRVEISNCKIYSLRIGNSSGRYILRDCEIASLTIEAGAEMAGADLVIERCAVFAFSLVGQATFRDLVLQNVEFYRGHAEFRGLRKKYPKMLNELDDKRSRDTFSRLFLWAEENGNSQVAHVVRAEELALERLQSTRFERVVLLSWSLFSGYGLYPLRPLLWLVAATFALFLLLFCSGTEANLQSFVGWRAVLKEVEGTYDDWLRAAVGCVEGIFTPLNAFSMRQLIVPQSFIANLLKALHGYFSLGMIFLVGFSLRRRFRHGS